MSISPRWHQYPAILLMILAAWNLRAADASDAKEQARACVACHPTSGPPMRSASGSPAIPITPIIWGQNAGYLYVQLRDFKRATRASANDSVMHAMTQPLTDAQMLSIAEYVSAQPWPALTSKSTSLTNPLVRRGAELVAYGDCGACHFNNWQGYSVTPRLRGQKPEYLTITIGEFRSGKRGNSPGMSDLLQVYTADEIKAMVAYLSTID